MKLSGLLDTELLQAHLAAKVVGAKQHPRLPLVIYNYGPKAQFENIWDDVSTQCRGLIVHRDTGEIVARGFRKFFNLNTSFWPESEWGNLPAELPEITTKLDGSLGILWRFDGQRGIATRGAFVSDQARWATKWYEENLAEAVWPEGWTPLFEIIFPENRIVVRYDWEGLALLALVNNETGEEMPYDQMEAIGRENGCRVVHIHVKTLDQCLGEDTPNEEGYVATWHRKGQSPLKVKIKFAEYCRLHRLLTGISPREIWRMISSGESLTDLADNAPENYVEWVRDWERRIRNEYAEIESIAKAVYGGCPLPKDGKDKDARKALAAYFTNDENRDISGVLFKMLDGQDYSGVIWRLVRPIVEGLNVYRPNEE